MVITTHNAASSCSTAPWRTISFHACGSTASVSTSSCCCWRALGATTLRRYPSAGVTSLAHASTYRWTHRTPHDPAAAVAVVAPRFVERDNQQPILLKQRALDQRIDVAREPPVRGGERAVVRVVAQIGHDVHEIRQCAVRQVGGKL